MERQTFLDMPRRDRLITSLFAAVLLICGAILTIKPPIRHTKEQVGNQEARRITTPAETSTLSVTLILAGVATAVLAINGLKITKLSVAPVSAEATGPGDKAEAFYSAKEQLVMVNVHVDDAEQGAPQPTESPVRILPTVGGGVEVYGLTEIPPSVLRDALAHWPATVLFPTDMSDFEFATRPTGKGNHAWTIRFKDKDAVMVSYGGRASTLESWPAFALCGFLIFGYLFTDVPAQPTKFL